MLRATLSVFLSTLVGLALFGGFPVSAQAQTWVPTVGGSWDNAANWNPATVPNSTTAAAILAGTTTQAVTLDAAITVNTLAFNNTAGAYTVSNGTGTGLTLAGTTPSITVGTAAVSNTISATLAGSTAWSKLGAGTLVLSSAVNTFTGNLTISAGVISIPASTAFNAAGTNSITLASGTFRSTSTGSGVALITSSHKFIVNGTGTIDLSGTGAILTYGNAAGDISPLTAGTGTITKSGVGTLRLNTVATNTVQRLVVTGGLWQGPVDAVFGAVPAAALADAITLNGGGISANGGFTMNVNRGITLGASGGTFNASSSFGTSAIIAGAGALNKTGANTLTLGGVNTYTGVTNITAGAIAITSANALGTVAGATIVTAGALNVSPTAAITTLAEPLTLNGTGIANAGALRNTTNFNNTFAGPITLGSTGVRINSDTGTLTLPGAIGGATFNLTFGGVGNIASNGAIGTTSGTLTKDGAGTTTLAGANTFTGVTTISAGTLTYARLVALYNNTPASWTNTNITVASGATASFNVGGTGEFTSTDIDTLAALGTATGGFLSGSILALDTANPGGLFTYSSTLTDTNSGANIRSFSKRGAGTLLLNGTNTYTGPTNVIAGTLQFGLQVSLYNNTPASWTATNIVVNSGTTLTLNVGGAGEFTATDLDTLSVLGTATGGFRSGSNLGIDTTNAGGTFTYNTVIANTNAAANVIGLTKAGTGNLVLGAANTYGGTTTILRGTVTTSVDNGIGAGPLTLSSTGSGFLGTLDLQTFNQTVGLITVASNNATANLITVGTGKTLTSTGGLTMGINGSLATTSALTITGGGAFSITGGNVQIGVSQSIINGSNNSTGVLDLTGLTGPFTATVTNFNVGQGNTSNGMLLLSAATNTITATTVNIGNSGGNNAFGSAQITLGEGSNTITADTINIALGKGTGTLSFASPLANSGTLTINNALDTGANITIGSNVTTVTGIPVAGLMDLRGHLSTVKANVLLLGGGANTSTGSTSGTLNFDTGTFTATTIQVANKTGSGSGTFSGNLNISGGTFTAATGGTFTLATNTGGGLAVATVNVTGGTLLSNVDILKGGGAGNNTATIIVNGGTLDLTNRNVGDALQPINNFTLQSGTLQNIAQFNNGAPLVKSTGTPSNILTLAGTNAFTGGLVINDGVLQIGSASAVPSTNTVAFGAGALAGTKLQLNGFNLTVAGLSTNANPGSASVESGSAAAGTDLLTVNTATANVFAGFLQNGGTRALALTKDGVGSLSVGGNNGPNTFTGATSVINGSLTFNSALTATTSVMVSGGTTFELNNGAGNQLTSLSTFNLGMGAGTTNLILQLGSVANSDTLQTSNPAAAVGTITFNIRALPGLGLNSYTLLSAASGLTANSPIYQIGTLPLGYTGTLSTISDTAVVLTITSVPAAGTAYWTGGVDTKWTTAGNFTSDLQGLNVAGAPGPNSTVIFSSQMATAASTSLTTIENDAIINNLVFNNETAGGTITSITIAPGTNPTAKLTLAPAVSTDGITVQAGAPVAITISAAVGVGAAQTWTVPAESALTVSGPVSLTNALTIGGVGPTTISGTLAGTAALTKINAGLLTLQANNASYSGVIAINGGTVIAGASNALGVTSAAVAASATLNVNGSNLGNLLVAIAGNGVGGNGALINTGASQINALRFLTLTADASVGGTALMTNRFDLRAAPTATLDFGGFTLSKVGGNDFHLVGVTVSNPGNIDIQGGEFFIETTTNLLGSASNTIGVASGATLALSANAQSNAWTVQLAGGGTVRSASGTNNWAGPVVYTGLGNIETVSALTLSGNSSGTGTLNKTGASSLTLTGTNGHSGGTTLNAGTLNINSATALGTGDFTITGGIINNSTAAALVLTTNNAQFWNGDFTFTGTQSLNLGTGLVTINSTRIVTVTANTLSISGIAETPAASIFGLTKAGAGTLAINGTSTYTGTTTASAGRLTLGATNAIGTGLLSVTGAISLNATTNLSGVNALPNAVLLGANLVVDGTNSVSFLGAMTLNGARTITNSLTGGAVLGLADLDLGGNLVVAGVSNVTVSGSTLNNAANRTITNNLSGGAVLTLNTINLSEPAALVARSLVLTSSGAGTTVVNGVIADGGFPGGILTIGGNNPSVPVVRLTNAANTFTGNVVVSSGALVITSGGALGVGPKTVTMTNGSAGTPELRLDGSAANITVPANISFVTSTGTLSGGIYNDAGNNTIAGNLTITTGGGGTTLFANAGTLTLTGNVAPSTTSRTLNLRGNAEGFITGVISGSGANIMPVLKDAGTGSWTLSGVNTYSGATTLNRGGLILGGNAPSGAPGTLGNATTQVLLGDIATTNAFDHALLVNGAFTVGRGIAVRTGTATLSNSGIATLGGSQTTGTAAFTGVVSIGSTANATSKTVQLTAASGGTVVFNGNIVLASGYTGSASIQKVGAGEVILDGTNTYNGTTTVGNGLLRINGSNLSAAGAVAVNGGITSGGTLRGVGSIGGLVTVNGGTVPGTLGGGNSGGTLVLANGLITTNGGRLLVEISNGDNPSATAGGSTAGALPLPTTNNYLNITSGGAIIDGGTLVLVDGTGANFFPMATYSYQIAQGAGNQSALNIAAPGQFNFNFGVDPSSVSLTGDASGAIFLNFVPVPEPTLLLGVLGVLALAQARRRRTAC